MPKSTKSPAEVLEAVYTPEQVIAAIADCANAIGWGAGEPGMEIAGGIVAFLAAHPQHIDRFLRSPSEVMMDGTFDPHAGCLTWRTATGEIINREIYNQRVSERQASRRGGEA